MTPKRIQKLITFSPQLYARAKQRAADLGLTFNEYQRFITAKDVDLEIIHPSVVSEILAADRGSLVHDVKGNVIEHKTIDEMMAYLEDIK